MKQKTYYPFYFAIAIVIFIGAFLNFPKKTIMRFNRNSKEAKIQRLLDYINDDYVDAVNTDSLLDGAINEMLSKLDPHSVYIPASKRKSIQESMNGNFVGVGIQFIMKNDSLTVVDVIHDGPSEKAGIKPGDRILIADKDTLTGKNLTSEKIIKTLKGLPNTKVRLNIYRKATHKILNFSLKRATIPIKSIDASYMLTKKLGYIKINKFAATTYNEFKKSLDKLKAKGMKDLTLDLRGNPGGYLKVATQIVDEFLKKGKLIVFTKNKGGKIDKTFATSGGEFEKGKLYVLIDEYSASASEIVAGALQDNDKGLIVGRRSFGKGLVQQEMDLGDGSAVRLTTARYYTPTGRSIQKPYDHNGSKNYYANFAKRFYDGELLTKDSIKVVDSLKYKTPKGKIVYGGGGIIPDVFVPIDTTYYVDSYHFRKMNDFVFSYMDNHRNAMSKYKKADFEANFDKNKMIFRKYISMLPEKLKNNRDRNYLKNYMKALFARSLFGDSEFFKIYNQNDIMIKKVLELEAKKKNN